jgi:cytochrome P450
METQRLEAAARERAPAMRRVGGASALAAAIQFGLDPIDAMKRVHAQNGPLTEFSFGSPDRKFGSRYIYAVGAKYNECVLRDPVLFAPCGVLQKGPHGSAQRRIRNGLLTAKGEHHKHYRRLMTPPLKRSAVDESAPKMGEVVDRVIEDWPIGREVDLFDLVKTVALHVALETLFSTNNEGLLAESLHSASLMNAHIKMDSSFSTKGCPFDMPGLPYRGMLQHAEKVESTVGAWARKGSAECQRDSLLSILWRSNDEHGKPPTEALVAGHLMSMFGASYETSQSGLAWALFLLAQNPDAAATLLDEITKPVEEGVDDDNVRRPWLEAVVKESLRILPPVPVQIRRARCDADLAGERISSGDYVVLSAFLTNRNPELYPEPDRFKPERWATLSPTQYEYLVFSAGPRFCLGAWFATTFLRVAILHIARRYRITLSPNTRIDQKVGLTMNPARTGIAVTIQRQDGRFAAASALRGNIQEIVRQ